MGSRDQGPQRVRDLLDRASSGLGIRNPVATGLMWSRWNQIVGADIAAHTEPSSLKDGVLRIRTDSPVWATEIGYLGDEIARRVNQDARRELVTEVKVWHGPGRVGRSAPAKPKGPAEGARRTAAEASSADPGSAFERAQAAWRKRRTR